MKDTRLGQHAIGKGYGHATLDGKRNVHVEVPAFCFRSARLRLKINAPPLVFFFSLIFFQRCVDQYKWIADIHCFGAVGLDPPLYFVVHEAYFLTLLNRIE